jgi:hypothetical protein
MKRNWTKEDIRDLESQLAEARAETERLKKAGHALWWRLSSVCSTARPIAWGPDHESLRRHIEAGDEACDKYADLSGLPKQA